MGQGATGIGDRATPVALEHELETLRDELGEVIGELDRRRHALFGWRHRLRRHKRKLVIAAACVALFVVWRRARRR
jgi:hypothetical protein